MKNHRNEPWPGTRTRRAFIRRQMMGREAAVAAAGGRLDVGIREQIFHGDFDGMPSKSIGE